MFFSLQSGRMGEMPNHTVSVKESCLTNHDGDLVEILRQLLVVCGCSPKALVRLFEYSAGRIPVKCRVSI